MQNFENNNNLPPINQYVQYPDPQTNEPFNRATHPAEKPVINKHIFAIDSRQRDYNVYPHANNYHLPIPDRYRNVTSIELKAAMLPRTEYNVNSTNKHIDFSVGDYISEIKVNNANVTYSSNGSTLPAPAGTYTVEITNSINGVGIGADIEVLVDSYGKIKHTSFLINDAGSGYSYSNPPNAKIIGAPGGGQFTANISVIVGIQYNAVLREGQYVIGGNPQFFNTDTPANLEQSWTPTNLVCEIENALSNAILQDPDYCYKRKSWITGDTVSHTDDYPLLFTTRLMSQYPTIDTYDSDAPASGDRVSENNYNTNSCKFNRMYFTNVLCFKMTDISGGYIPSNGDIFTDSLSPPGYKILHNILMPGTNASYIVYCSLTDSSLLWPGLTEGLCTSTSPAGPTFQCNIIPWEMLFATGDNQVINSASLLGFNKRNYSAKSVGGVGVDNDVIQVSNLPVGAWSGSLVPRGLSFSTENDYYLFGDPEYIVLSFRPKYGGNNITGINDRVDSNDNSNINRVFACLVYDTVLPAVLQDVSSGASDCVIGSISSSNNKNLNTFMNYDKNFSEVKQLTGNSGSQNASYNRPAGQLKAMKGADFDRKIVEFPQPIAQIFDINIRFTKFSKGPVGTDSELYNFQGKEHLLLFEITCGDLMTGRRS